MTTTILTHPISGKKFIRVPVGSVQTGDQLDGGLYVQLAASTPFSLNGEMVKDYWVGARKINKPAKVTVSADATQRRLDK